MLRKEFIIFLLILFIFIILNNLFNRECLNHQSIKFLNAIKQQKQGLNIIRNEKNVTDYELTILNIQRQFNETWKEYLIDHKPLKLITGDAEIKYFLKFNNPNIECNVITM
uniref:Uncharacterized protein n=1 Tax=Meloidogyne hapla TaxID=6305 RepID=A0A1I8BVZ1_MELHA